MGTLYNNRITSASDQGNFPTDLSNYETAVIEAGGLSSGVAFSGRQWAPVDANGRLSSDVGWTTAGLTNGTGVGEKEPWRNAGENLTFGQTTYLKSDGQYWKTNCATETVACINKLGLSLGSYSTGNPAVILRRGFACNTGWSWTVGGLLYLDAGTSGGMTQTAPGASGNVIRCVGYAESATIIYFDPDRTWVTHV